MLKEKIIHYSKVICSTPFKILLIRIYRKISEILKDSFRSNRIVRKSLFLSDRKFYNLLRLKGDFDTCLSALKGIINNNPLLQSILNSDDKRFVISKLSKKEKEEIIKLADEYCEHRFDLLGSGKVVISYTLDPNGVHGYVYNMKESDKKITAIKEKIESQIKELFNDPKIDKYIGSDHSYNPIDWHVDYKSGYRWDNKTWYKKLKYGCNPGADVKNPWELSRFHHLVTLGQAYSITRDEKYSLEYIFQIVDWIINNPVSFGINWRSILDVSLRAANWIISFSFFKDSKLINKRFLLFFLKSVYMHGKHIFENLEYHSITSNHYLSDLSGLYFIGEIFSDFGIGKKWIDFTIYEITKEIDKQIYDDGGDFEASTCYHRFVLELLIYPILFRIRRSEYFRKNNYIDAGKKLFGEEIINKLYKMFEYVLYTLKPDGTLPQIGDNDNGRLFIFKKTGTLDIRYLLSFGAIFFKEKKFKVKEYGFSDELLWVFGQSGFNTWNQLEHIYLADIGSRSFADSGLYVLRNEDDYLIASCGQNGQNDNGGHAHNDKLSFELYTGGQTVIVDPGSYIYTGLPEWRDKFRSTIFHSTVMIDKYEQNRFKNNNLFSLENDSTVSINNWSMTPEYDYLEAEHNGYKRINKDMIHKRQFIYDKIKNYWLIKDDISGKGQYTIESFFQLGPDVKFKINNNNGVTVNMENKSFNIIPLSENIKGFSIESGWYSGSYGRKKILKIIKYSNVEKLPANFLFLFYFNDYKPLKKDIDELLTKVAV